MSVGEILKLLKGKEDTEMFEIHIVGDLTVPGEGTQADEESLQQGRMISNVF